MEFQPSGTRGRPFRLAIIGGGPAGCSVIVRALRLGVIKDLCSGSQYEAGVCLFEKDKSIRFGGGRLQDYIINSNTFAAKFATNVMNEKLEVDPPERSHGTTLVALENLPSKFAVESYGNSHLPLNVAGNFLRDVGTVVMDTLAEYPACRCSTGVDVISIQRCIMEPPPSSPASPLKSTTAKQGVREENSMRPITSPISTPRPNKSPQSPTIIWKIEICSHDSLVHEFVYAKNVVLATGGRQEIPKNPSTSSSFTNKCMTSDHVCTAAGAAELKERLLAAGGCGKPGRVLIIGGSHSAFSAAWICLNKVQQTAGLPAPSTIKIMQTTESAATTTTTTTTTTATTSTANSKVDDGVGGSIGQRADSSTVSAIRPTTVTTANNNNNNNNNNSSNNNSSSNSSNVTGVVSFGSSGIVMMHRSSIKVFYSMKKEADADNYFDIGQVNKVTGQIHPFGGLRGDAKELFRQIKSGKETRVRLMLIKSQTNSIVNKLYDEATVIIWACGYNTNQITIKDVDDSIIPLRQFRGQVEVDDNAHILTDKVLQGVAQLSTLQVGSPERNIIESPSSLSPTVAPNGGRFSPAAIPMTPGSPSRRDRSLGAIGGQTPNEIPRAALTAQNGNTTPANGTACTIMSTAGTSVTATTITTAASAASPSVVGVKVPVPPYRVGNLLGSGLGYGFKATYDNGEPDGSSGRADGVAVYLKRGATLVLSVVLGPRVFGEGVRSWEERTQIINITRKALFQASVAESRQLTASTTTIPASPGSNTHHNDNSSTATTTVASRNRVPTTPTHSNNNGNTVGSGSNGVTNGSGSGSGSASCKKPNGPITSPTPINNARASVNSRKGHHSHSTTSTTGMSMAQIESAMNTMSRGISSLVETAHELTSSGSLCSSDDSNSVTSEAVTRNGTQRSIQTSGNTTINKQLSPPTKSGVTSAEIASIVRVMEPVSILENDYFKFPSLSPTDAHVHRQINSPVTQANSTPSTASIDKPMTMSSHVTGSSSTTNDSQPMLPFSPVRSTQPTTTSSNNPAPATKKPAISSDTAVNNDSVVLSPRSAAAQAKRVDDVVERLTRPKRSQSLTIDKNPGAIVSAVVVAAATAGTTVISANGNNKRSASVSQHGNRGSNNATMKPTSSSAVSPRWQQQHGKIAATSASLKEVEPTMKSDSSVPGGSINGSTPSKGTIRLTKGVAVSEKQTTPASSSVSIGSRDKSGVVSGNMVKYTPFTAAGLAARTDYSGKYAQIGMKLAASSNMVPTSGRQVVPAGYKTLLIRNGNGNGVVGKPYLTDNSVLSKSLPNAIALPILVNDSDIDTASLFNTGQQQQQQQQQQQHPLQQQQQQHVQGTLVVSPVKLTNRLAMNSNKSSPLSQKPPGTSPIDMHQHASPPANLSLSGHPRQDSSQLWSSPGDNNNNGISLSPKILQFPKINFGNLL